MGIGIYYFQDFIFFRNVPLSRQHKYDFEQDFREVNLPYDAQSNINIIQFSVIGPAKGCVIYFHGNRRNISWYARFAPMFTQRGYEVWMIDYPGYGKSTGRLQEDVLHAYATQLYKLARKRFEPQQLVLYGKSMGTGIAARLAADEEARVLILETPYYSFESLAAFYFPIYPVKRMIRNRLPTFEFLPKVEEPVIMFHGTSDWIIPYRNARKLEPLLKLGDQFITIPGGGHNDLEMYAQFRDELNRLLP
jgi:alpha-beta hydrolase superfamily lysophospholipase